MIGTAVAVAVADASAFPFNPASLALWLRADLGITPNGSNVAAWLDQSPNKFNFPQATPANQPPLTASGIGSLPSIDTRAVANRFLASVANANVILSGTAATRFVVMQANASQATGTGRFGDNWGSAVTGTYCPWVDNNFYDELDSTVRKTIGALDAHTTPIVYCTTSSATDFTVYRNGTQFFTTATNAVGAPASVLSLLGSTDGGVYWQGLLSEVIVYTRELGTTELASVTSYLRTRYGI